MYSPRYREEPSIGTCEEDRVLRKLTELNVNKSPRFMLYYLCERDIPWVPEDIFFLRLVNAASPRTISLDKKKISSGTQGKRDRIMISNLQHSRKIAVLHVDGFLTCFGSAASAFENIDLGYIHCALKENFSVTLKGFTCVLLICRELLVHSVATKHKVVKLGN